MYVCDLSSSNIFNPDKAIVKNCIFENFYEIIFYNIISFKQFIQVKIRAWFYLLVFGDFFVIGFLLILVNFCV